MKDEVPFQDFPAYTEQTAGKSKALGIFLIALLVIAGVVGGLYLLGRNKNTDKKSQVSVTKAPTPTEAPTETPSATPSGSVTPSVSPSGTSSKLDRSKLSVAVLNGSGVPGAASKTSSALKSLGYTIGATTNADKFTYTGITVLVKKAKKDYGDLLKKDLSDQGDVTVTVDDTIPTDAQVIVGK
jgi:hypothetical protein